MWRNLEWTASPAGVCACRLSGCHSCFSLMDTGTSLGLMFAGFHLAPASYEEFPWMTGRWGSWRFAPREVCSCLSDRTLKVFGQPMLLLGQWMCHSLACRISLNGHRPILIAYEWKVRTDMIALVWSQEIIANRWNHPGARFYMETCDIGYRLCKQIMSNNAMLSLLY